MSLKSVALIAGLLAATAISSFGLMSTAADTSGHACTHCLQNSNSCCPGLEKSTASDKHNCPHCIKNNYSCCCPTEKKKTN